MTLYLTPELTPDEIRKAKEAPMELSFGREVAPFFFVQKDYSIRNGDFRFQNEIQNSEEGLLALNCF